MKITLFNWAGESRVDAVFEELGFKHNAEINQALYDSYNEIVDLFVDRGLAVIVKPHVHEYKRKKGEPRNQPPPPAPEKQMTIFVDTRLFQTR